MKHRNFSVIATLLLMGTAVIAWGTILGEDETRRVIKADKENFLMLHEQISHTNELIKNSKEKKTNDK